jgi:putative phosphoesterase
MLERRVEDGRASPPAAQHHKVHEWFRVCSMAAINDLRVGLISDTHGLLRPEARAFLVGCDYIVHGGDIGEPQILDELAALAPLIAVRGNNDTEPWAARLPLHELIKVGNVFVYVIHNLAELDIDPRAAGIRVVVSGHSHKPKVEERDGVLYVNPGSSGPRRFKLPISVGEVTVSDRAVKARLVNLLKS